MKPRISVILPTYRRAGVLPRAIESVLRQTRSDWELLVVDDEPSPTTEQICSNFRDNRLRYLAHHRNRGLSAARNTGIRNACGEFIAFLDDDDVFLERKLELQAEALEQAGEQVGVVSCFEEIRATSGSVTFRKVTLEGGVHRLLLANDLVRMQLLMVRSACFDQVGLFDERLAHHEDFDMTLRLSKRFHFTTVPLPLVGIIATPESLSTNVGNRIEALKTIMETHPEFRDHRRIRARWQRRLARHYGELGLRADWRDHLLQAIQADPVNIATWAALCVGSIFGPAAQLKLGRLRGQVARAARLAGSRGRIR